MPSPPPPTAPEALDAYAVRALLLLCWIGLWFVAPVTAIVPMVALTPVRDALPSLPDALAPIEDLLYVLGVVNGTALLSALWARFVAPLIGRPRPSTASEEEQERRLLRPNGRQLSLVTALPLVPLYPYAFFWGATLWSSLQQRHAYLGPGGTLHQPQPPSTELMQALTQAAGIAVCLAVLCAVLVMLFGLCLRRPQLVLGPNTLHIRGVLGGEREVPWKQVYAIEHTRRGHLTIRTDRGNFRPGRLPRGQTLPTPGKQLVTAPWSGPSDRIVSA